MGTIFSILLTLNAQCVQPDDITRQIGLEMLRGRMIEQQRQRRKSIDTSPPGYFLIGYTVLVG